MPISFYHTVLPAGFLVGVVLLWLGFRGRQIGGEPRCRRCGYDLTGRPDDSNSCAECGADADRRSDLFGKVSPEMIVAATGGLIVLIASIPMIPGVGNMSPTTHGASHAEPTPVFHFAAHLRSHTRRECRTRTDPTLSGWQIGPCAARVNAAGLADKDGEFGGGGMRILELAEARADLSSADWDRFCKGMYRIELDVRPRIRQARSFPRRCRHTSIFTQSPLVRTDDRPFWS